MSNQNKGRKSIKYNYDYLYLIPVIVFAAIVPIVVYMHVIPLTGNEIVNWTGGTESYDFFSYWKAIIIRAAGALAILFIILKAYTNRFEIKKTNYYIPMAVYSLFVILSAILSPYKEVASRGFVDRFEGVYVILCYILMMFVTINFVQNEKHVKIITIGILISASIIGIIGILQFVGIDIFKLDLSFILPKEYKPYADEFTFTFDKYTIYSTLYNTNYVGSYMVMVFSISLAIFLYVKKAGLKIVTGLLTCLMFANLIGCRSRAGIVGAIFSLLIMLVVYRKVLKRNLIYIGGIAVLCVIGFVIFNTISHGTLLNKYVGEVKTFIANVTGTSVEENQKNPLKDIRLNGNELKYVTNNEELDFVWENGGFVLLDNSGNNINYSINENNSISIDDERYKDYNIVFAARNIADIKYYGMSMRIVGTDENRIAIVGERGDLVYELAYPESFGFKDKEKLGSNRGYIWSRSVPMLKKALFVGSGPDTYAIVFPQKDYVGKLRAFGNLYTIVDKPHNMYLQMGINTGVISMLAIIALFIMYFISSIKLYFNNKFEDKISYLGFGMFMAFCGYAVTGLFNDSIVSVAPVFWVILGLGISCNYIIKHPETLKNKVPGNKQNKVPANAKK